MNAVVLVGGEGTRLRPLTSTVPKPLLPIAGQPFIERQLLWLASYGVTHVVLSLGYLPDAFATHFPTGEFAGVRLSYAVEPYPLGTAGGIRFATTAAGIDERVIVCNGDVLTTLDVGSLVRFHEDRRAEATIHLTRVDDPTAFGVVPTFDDGEVKAFVEKPPASAAPTSWINAGTYVLEPSVLQRIPADLTASIERETFPRMLEQRGHLYALATDDYWLDIGTPDKYLQAHSDTLRGVVGLPPVAGAREVEPGIWAQASYEIGDDVTLTAPVLLGAEVAIGRGARVEDSTISRGSVVAADATVTGAVLLDGARVERGARVDHSIVDAGGVVDEEASVLGCTIVGAGAHVPRGARLDGARIELPAATG